MKIAHKHIFSLLNNNIYQKNIKSYKNDLPGPVGLPIIGNLLGLKDNPYSTMDYYHILYGGIYRLWLGEYYMISVSDPDIVREMLVKNHSSFSSRPNLPIVAFGSNNFKGISGSSGTYWKKNRNLLLSAMKGANTKHVYELLNYKVQSLIEIMNTIQLSNDYFEPRIFAPRFAISTMFKYLFNENIPYFNHEDKLISLIQESFSFMTLGNVGDFFSKLHPLYFRYLHSKGKCFEKIRDFLREKYNEHYQTIDKEKPRDLLDFLIYEYGEPTEENITTIIQVLFDLLLAGTDTVYSSIEWILLLFTNNYDYQQKIYKELKEVVGNRERVLLSDRPQTVFTQACIKEAMRFKAPSPFGLPHTVTQDILIKDYFIPKDSMVLVNYYSIAQNHKYFPNPHIFDPYRFMGTQQPDGFMVFSVGSRACLGQSLAMDSIYLLISNIILNFNLKSIDGKKIDDSNHVSGLNLRPNRYKLKLEKRY
ncbi:hypothetical protein DICPUDRAFT_83304 [Dictyostelium purpureum]|uniref:Cytochrome P450 family protein n=1 Tax=Dictyostelium purpureum TaxID=5786 RepID=F0ZZ55_DICPU|nr:uncharacterized protein DICPUDRAFT_83304 [Dictyostelium purpureum]EGC30778.1 hypothetical protein DICPUDRAFT_83304 [Dictyostelium purpureum]|eukprot:XP_003292694.1 hypothetical protein DICPUDRAFT_83304 [Dictyostelium purpureum]